MICSVCREGQLTDKGDCLNGECVASARLPTCDDYVCGQWEVDGPFSALRADGTREGQLRVIAVDDAWAKQLFDFVRGG